MQATVESLTPEQTKAMILYIGEKVIEAKPTLTEIDSAIGDGDHGIGMETGFNKATENLLKLDPLTIQEVFKTTGMSMISSMGGASGVIFGTLFTGGLKTMADTNELNTATLSDFFQQSLLAIQTRGKASVGDKTMIDALAPAVEAFKQGAAEGLPLYEVLQRVEAASLQGVEDTKELTANFGRAKSLGKRAIGHQDAGATTVWIIFRSMKEWIELVST
ncbi:dihydroxyacetone kinase subunit DhaL [Shouchella patagoniensis]|uniref:dihydroxyacetone kinase subunit DhaL n=1 Tax=Shouchella patagoniensis TaxID=228576 RepID=UPI0014767DC4|nr:dihydroxyacetone kinase subunit DhaL [Shouchella patagoniensis]